MFSKVNSIGIQGFNTQLVEVECDLSSGLPRFDIVGLPGSAVSESKQRVRSAIKNNKLNFPISRITVNLAPAEFRKEGAIYDLPILVAILLASGQISNVTDDCIFIGELSLDGDIRQVNGILPMTAEAKRLGIKNIFLPDKNANEAALVPEMNIYPVKSVHEILEHFSGVKKILPTQSVEFKNVDTCNTLTSASNIPDFSDVFGQQGAKRALEIAVAGKHNVLFVGSPGAGKSMLAKRIPGILPDMTFDEAIETTSVYSVLGGLNPENPLILKRPFRSPHHTITKSAFAGGGIKALPGEISLAHNGILFLDELTLFHRATLETLREPLEEGKITVSRNACTAVYPARIILVCAMNPCPCGFLFDPVKKCACSDLAIKNYMSKISGPLLDRIDIHIKVDPIDCESYIRSGKTTSAGDTSKDIRLRVESAISIQQERFKGTDISYNSEIPPSLIRKYCMLTPDSEELFIAAFKRLKFSARAHDKILKVARTIADLDNSEYITSNHISEAIQYRSLDRLDAYKKASL